jgi:hypothetical protein
MYASTHSSLDNQTNVFFITDDGQIFIQTMTNIYINPELIAAAKTNRESWPAKEFPEGNWGELKEGGQISLRFDKQVYTNQEPINVVILVRNTTNHVIFFYNANDVAPGEINFLAYDQSKQLIPQKQRYLGLRQPSAGGVNIVRPGLQRKYVDTLNRTYDLTNGNYFVEASITLRPMTGTNTSSSVEVKSEKVPITIK